MKIFIKVLVVLSLFSTFSFAQNIDEKVVKFEKERFSKNGRVEIKEVSVNMKKELPNKWYGYILDIKALMAGKNINAKDIVFSDGKVITGELFDINSAKSFKDEMNPTLTAKYYDKTKLIAGNIGAKNKIVIFSDPLCPFCIDLTPDIIKHVQKNSNSIALYYYHFPLIRIHPASKTLVKLMSLARQKGIKDVELKIYSIDWEKYFIAKETDAKKIIAAFNKEFKTSYTQKDISSKKIDDEILHDISMGEDVLVQGTPTIFVNGEKDKTKLKYEMLGN